MSNSNQKAIILVTVLKTDIKTTTYVKYINFGHFSVSMNIKHDVFKHILYCANMWLRMTPIMSRSKYIISRLLELV